MVLTPEEIKDMGKVPPSFPKNVNLPIYDDERTLQAPPSPQRSVVTTTIESYVRAARLRASGLATSVKRLNENVNTKYNTAKAHTAGVVDFLQSEPELWQRCGIVAVAGFTGFISGYRRTNIIKTRNMLLASGVAASICWPKQTVEVVSDGYNRVKEPIVQLWTEYAPGSPYQPRYTAVIPPAKFYSNKPTVEEDHGQSKEEDKDMYSTRGS